MADAPSPVTVAAVAEVARWLKEAEGWFRGQVEGWRMDAPDIDEDGSETIVFRDSTHIDRFADNLRAAHELLTAVVEVQNDMTSGGGE